jgi:hypothetical protein
MESSQNENVMIIDGANECNMKNNFFNVNFQTQQNIIEQIDA